MPNNATATQSATTEILMALGEYRFSIDTAAPQETDRITTYRWVDIPVINSQPTSQYLGRDLDEFTIKGSIYPLFKGGFEQVEKMREEAAKGRPLRLVTGTGFDAGLFTIRKITQRDRKLFTKGVPRKIEFELVLREFANNGN